MDDVLVRGDRATYHWTFTGANTGPGGTGQRVRFSGFEVWKIGDGGATTIVPITCVNWDTNNKGARTGPLRERNECTRSELRPYWKTAP